MNPNLIIHRRDRANAGDMASSPKAYFKWLKDWDEIDIVDVEFIDLSDRHIILGGGGLFYDDFAPFMYHIIEQRPKMKSLTLWGIGRNRHGIMMDKTLPKFGEDLIQCADLVGIRDCEIHPDWVPCPSVMHPAFDRDAQSIIKRSTVNEVLVCQHREERFRINYPKGLDDWDELKMQGDLLPLLRTIIMSDHVLSSSYHGALWGLCGGAKVGIVNAFSQKFLHGLPQNRVDFLTENQVRSANLDDLLNSIPANDDFQYLKLARMRAFNFASEVKKLVEKQPKKDEKID